MNWVVSLVGCGGPAVSRCGHETRRHRVRGALFASVFASVLLAACGGGSGGNLTTSSEREPGPPGPGPLTATGGGGNESEEEQQQEIVVNIQPEPEEEEQIIVVNIQPPEESNEEESEEEEQQKIVVNQEDQGQGQESESENDQESDDNNNEETPQQLTIIEEEVIEFRPPEKPKPTYSAQGGTQQGIQQPAPTEHNNVFELDSGDYTFTYGIWLTNDPTKNNMSFLRSMGNTGDTGQYPMFNDLSDDRDFSIPGLADYLENTTKLTATYYKKGGFRGSYHYGGKFGNIVGDVNLRLEFEEDEDIAVTGTLANNVTMGGYNFGNLGINSLDLDEDHDIGTGTVSLGSTTITTNSMEAVLSNRPEFNGRLYAESGGTFSGIWVIVGREAIKDKFNRFIRYDPKLLYASKDGYKKTAKRVDMTGYNSISNPLGEKIYDKSGNRTTFYKKENNQILILDEESNLIPVSELTDWFDLGRKIVVDANGKNGQWDSEPERLVIERVKQHRIHLPNRIAGEIKTTGFRHSDDTESTASKNALYGVFIGEVHGKKPLR